MSLPLRRGSQDPKVVLWGAFLYRRAWRSSFAGPVFDAESEAGTRAFQAMAGLDVTGEVDLSTWNEGASWGLNDIGWPTTTLKSLSLGQREAIFGKFTYKASPYPGNPEAIVVDPAWVKANIVHRPCPQLEGKSGFGKGSRVAFHTKAIEPFLALIAAWEEAGLMDRIVSWGGSYVPRFIRGSQAVLSNHSYGSAFDVNTVQNPLGAKGAPVGAIGCVYELVPLAEKHGWAWGGTFGRVDAMHFELAIVK